MATTSGVRRTNISRRPLPEEGLRLAHQVAIYGVLLTILAAAPEAHAFCRAVTELPPVGWDPQTQGCFVGQPGDGAKGMYWKNACVGYSLQKGASSEITLEQATAVAGEAFAAWSDATCPQGGHPSIKSMDLGPVDCDRVEYNKTQPNQNIIVFRDSGWPGSDPANTLGLTHVFSDLSSGEIVGADMELNSQEHVFVAEGPVPDGSFNLKTVITHEAGHFLGLGHSSDPTAIMFANYAPDAMGLGPDDIEGICALYPPDGTRVTSDGTVIPSDSCDPTPRHGFSSECAVADAGVAEPAPSKSSGGCSVAHAPSDSDNLGGLLPGMVVGLVLGARRLRGTSGRASACPGQKK